jgi:hypothetical protein
LAITKEILAKLRLDSKEFSSKLSEGQAGIIKFTAGMTALGTAVLAATKMTANYRDETVKAARAAGSTAEDFSALRYAADLSGVSMETLGKGLRKLNEPSKEAQAAMSKMGISLYDVSGKAKTQNQLLADIADGLKALPTPAQKSAAAVEIFGNKGASMVNMLASGSSELQKLTEEATRMGLVFDEKAGAAAELFNDNITRVTSSVKGFVQQVTGSIIELVNQTGIMQGLAKAIQNVTGWWMNLDDTTKNIIVTIGGVVAGVSAFLLAAAGIIAIAPAIGAAITAMTGGLNLIVLAVIAAVAAFAVIATGAAMYWDQVKSAIEPAQKAIENFAGSISAAFAPIGEIVGSIVSAIGGKLSTLINDFKSWLGITDKSTENISYLGTVSKVVFAAIGSLIIIAIGAFKLFNDAVQLVATSIVNLGAAFKAGMEWDFDKAEAALNAIKDSANKLKDDFVGIGDKIKASFSNIVVKVDAAAARKEISNLNNDLNRTLGGSGGEPEWLKGLKKFVGSIAGPIQQIGGMIGQVADMIVESMKSAMERINLNMDVMSGLYSQQMDETIKKTESEENRKLALLKTKLSAQQSLMEEQFDAQNEALSAQYDAQNELLNNQYDSQIKALQDAEAQKISAVEFAANERLLLLDNEYQTAKDRKEEEFALYMEQEEANYEIEKELLLQKSIDKEQRMLVEDIMDNDHKLFLENQQKLHDEAMKKMSSDYLANKKETETLEKEESKALEADYDAQIKALTTEKNESLKASEKEKDDAITAADAAAKAALITAANAAAAAITAAEDEKNNKLLALQKQKDDEEKKMKKLQLLMNWKAEQSQFQSTKGMRIADTVISGVAGAAMAFAGAAGTIPIVGIIIGAVLAAAVLAMTFASVGQMAAQQPPSAPAALFLASGGVLAGPSHAAGGIPSTLEGGEAVIDKARTEKFMDTVDNVSSENSGKSLSIIFQPGSIVNQGEQITDSFIDKISYAISRRMERQGVFA